MHWWLIIIALWLAPAIVLGCVLLLIFGKDRLSRRRAEHAERPTRPR